MRGALVALALLAGAGAAAADPSFPCGRAATAAERLVCGDPDLALFDRALAAVYRRARAGHQAAGLVSNERAWLGQRDACGTTACLARSYHAQIEAVSEAIDGGPGRFVRADGQARLIVLDVVGEPAIAFRIDATYTGRSVNVGAVAGAARIAGGTAHYSVDDGGVCAVDLRRSAIGWVVATVDATGCGLGANVRLDGRYAPVAR